MRGVVEVLLRRRKRVAVGVSRAVGVGSPFFHLCGEQVHVSFPKVADDLRASQYAPRTRARWCGSTLPQEKQRMGTIILACVIRACVEDRGDQVSRAPRTTR
jgi:hypothetical protein